ncbi:MAG: glutamate synthase large subunit [Spirochaetaceae bacterium]|jgi:glutamate synthase (NADPH/NADH) large chain|nr:glutamate synthase large subunit [Spirochaetaceae bacterium]
MGGLYSSENEHDSCGIGFVANIGGEASHEILERALEVLERMTHRGAESADDKTGDGAGVLMQIPHEFYKKTVARLRDGTFDKPASYGTGLLFLPKNGAAAARTTDSILKKVDEFAAELGLDLIALRDVPVDSGVMGAIAGRAEPSIKQLFLSFRYKNGGGADDLNFALYVFRKKLEKYTREELKTTGCYMPSLSASTIVYKGMLMPRQLREYYPELTDGAMKTAVALVHSRFSTNTFPAWALSQPFRMIAHNGEINTVKGNRFWAAARESLYAHARFSGVMASHLAGILPVIEPDASDSASFDNMLELLVMSGRSLPHALMMLIPEAWNDKNPIGDDLKRFYEYQACMMEPWDGPASMVFCDGRYVGGTLDRNGLRPSRYTITKGGMIVMGSETGVQDFAPEEVQYKGRLEPGKLLLVDLKEGRIIPNDEVKREVSTSKPYTDWVGENLLTLEQEKDGDPIPADPFYHEDRRILFLERSFGYTREDCEKLLLSMAVSGQEPTSSMGTDTPLAVFSDRPQRVFSYFKQMFAQVTNPPIDSIREDLVMTLTSFAGPQKNLLEETAEHCRRVKVVNPILTAADLERLLKIAPGIFKSTTLEAVFSVPAEDGAAAAKPCAMEAELDALISRAVKAVEDGAAFIVLSDKAALEPSARLCAIPSLLALGAVHHGLIRAGLRMKVSLIVESGEPREIMHFALLFGYGADLVYPYGALGALAALCRGFDGRRAGDYRSACHNYLKGLQKAMLKVMSKMGTSTLRSYRGAQIFEAVGLGPEVIEKCFRGTASRIGGAGFPELEAETLERRRMAAEADERSGGCPAPEDFLLYGDGQYRWRRNGERHAWNPETIHLLQWAARTADYARFKQFSAAANSLNQSPHVIRGLLDFAKPGTVKGAPAVSIPINEVESAEEIMKRFTTGAMSFGSISKEAHETIAEALNSIQGRSNSGEGGEDPARFARKPDGRWTRSAIKQVASGRFGVTSEYLANAVELQIKMAQGAKPGEGGQLPGHKVDVQIGKTRHSTPGVTLISPPPHHDIYSIEDLAELIFDLKNANPEARISVKLVSENGVGTVAAGVAKAHADNILISGYDGGTGASPQSSIRHAGLPWELGIAETHQTLLANGLRGRVRLQTDGQIKTGRDIVIAGMLGAEEFGFGTSTLIVLGCVMMRKCHENTCPMGVATQDPVLRSRFAGKSKHLITFFRFLAEEVREIMAELGFRTFNELVGRSDMLTQRQSPKQKSANIDLSALLAMASGPDFVDGGQERYCTQDQVHNIKNVVDRTLIERCRPSLDQKIPTALKMDVRNTDRAVGAMLSYEVSRRFGGTGLPENFITVDWAGSAGQSFGAFLAPGITFRLAGDANDYFGKGLSGGRIAVFPPPGSTFASEKNIIIGNTALYGATGGAVFVAGLAGERFCVRNSGALAVVEGAGDHCAEYMTGGRLVVLGSVGRNFAAGMSGGIAYVLDRYGNGKGGAADHPFEYFLNSSMVELSRLESIEDEAFVLDAIEKHIYWTGSAYAKTIRDNWAAERLRLYKVLPVEYKRALEEQKLAELDRKLYDIRKREEISEKS